MGISKLMTKVSYICAVLLFIGAMSMPSEYYQLLRWVICPAAAFLAFIYYGLDNKMPWVIGFGVVALIFNPFVPLYLYDKFTWTIIDIVAGIMFVVSAKDFKTS